ncbi:MBL fold metallo-hydrolase [Alicyclobacillus fastidiosus]|uniref:MBL fold metallo-hydrolase n=1 Tax=Alicyclobacillus fastidiosus TaxID=392011 RepID=UPI0023E9E1EC|nr:MBL fold metallo-hydrolase [Alicyclobacillus fastidiosus]GMA62263.1 hypothetical protein GCM10025859_27030 [Alicyclobacillus fastidiosus]
MVWLTVVVVVILVVLVAGALFFMLYRRATSRWPHPPYRSPEASPKPDEWGDEGLYIAWIGHSTLLIRMDGVNIITDPVFSERVGVSLPLCTIGPRRHVAPALALAQCPQSMWSFCPTRIWITSITQVSGTSSARRRRW